MISNCLRVLFGGRVPILSVHARPLDLRVVLGQANVSCVFILISIPNLTYG